MGRYERRLSGTFGCASTKGPAFRKISNVICEVSGDIRDGRGGPRGLRFSKAFEKSSLESFVPCIYDNNRLE